MVAPGTAGAEKVTVICPTPAETFGAGGALGTVAEAGEASSATPRNAARRIVKVRANTRRSLPFSSTRSHLTPRSPAQPSRQFRDTVNTACRKSRGDVFRQSLSHLLLHCLGWSNGPAR